MLKVLALLPDYLETPMGGLGVQFNCMYDHLKDEVEYYIVGCPEKPKIKNFKGIPLPFPDFNFPAIKTIYDHLLYYHTALEFNTEFDIIHCFDWSTAIAGVYLSRHFKKPLIYGMNLSARHLNEVGTFFCFNVNELDGAFINYFMTVSENFGLKYANKITQVSTFYKNLYLEYENKTAIVRNGLNISEWEPKRPVKFPGKNRIKVCYIGRACSMKGIDMIYDCEIPGDIDFYFIASQKGAESAIWQMIKDKTNNKNIFHIEGLFGQDKIDFLNGVDAVVMPSKHEPAGIVAMEALISKNILITTATGGIAETVEGVDYLECRDSNSLSECLKLLTRLDSNSLEKLKISGYKKMLECDWKKSANQLLKLYKETVGEKILEPDESNLRPCLFY